MQTYFDIVDEHDEPVGKAAPYSEVHQKGLWHRGVHIIIYTPQKEIVMQKRSPSLLYHPDEIEVSVGGGVDAGETPKAAALREAGEELQLTLQPNQLRFIGKTKFNHHTKTQINRCFIYSYAACIAKSDLSLQISPEENSMVFFITEKKLRAALRKHRIKKIGKISSLYAYWRYLLNAI